VTSTVSLVPILALGTEICSALGDCFRCIWIIVLRKVGEVDIYLFVEKDLRACNLDSEDNPVVGEGLS